MNNNNRVAFGKSGLTLVDKFGTWLSTISIRRAVKNRKKLCVLELGCGFHAKNLVTIVNNCEKVYCVDFNLDSKLAEKFNFLLIETGIDEAMPKLIQYKFDVILIISVLEHLHKPLEVLENCWQMLSPGGILLINVPTWQGKFFLELSAFKFGLSPKEEMDDHKMYYSKRDLWPMLVKAGFLPSKISLKYHKFGLNLFAEAHKN